jgi:hypothetical protein
MRAYTLLLIAVLASCELQPKTVVEPNDLIPKDSMITIMYDMGILESHIQQKFIQLESYAKVMRISGDSLLAKFGVSRERYSISMDYYSKSPALFSEIYDSIISKYEAGTIPKEDILDMDQLENSLNKTINKQ